MVKAESTTDKRERRTSGVQRTGRASRVLNSVLTATGEELAAVGYSALRIEDVARRAGVNKTTIYRRWPGKSALVSEAILKHMHEASVSPDTGTLRGDLLEYFQALLRSSREPLPRGILLTLNSHVDPELDVLAKKLRAESRRYRTRIVENGIERGELPRALDAGFITDILASPILLRVLHYGEQIDMGYVESVIDTVLAGAAANAFRGPVNRGSDALFDPQSADASR